MAKAGIHPTYHDDVKVVCICGEEYTISATVTGPIKIENCPACHPLYTGKKENKVVKGRMEKFLEKQKRMEALQKKSS